MQSVGKASEDNTDLEFREHIRMMLCTSFLPVKDVITAFENLQSTGPEECEPEDNYIGRYKSTGHSQKTQSTNQRWNCCERIKKCYPRGYSSG